MYSLSNRFISIECCFLHCISIIISFHDKMYNYYRIVNTNVKRVKTPNGYLSVGFGSFIYHIILFRGLRTTSLRPRMHCNDYRGIILCNHWCIVTKPDITEALSKKVKLLLNSQVKLTVYSILKALQARV